MYDLLYSDRFLAEQEGWFGRLKGKGFYSGLAVFLLAIVELVFANSDGLRHLLYGDAFEGFYKDPVHIFVLPVARQFQFLS